VKLGVSPTWIEVTESSTGNRLPSPRRPSSSMRRPAGPEAAPERLEVALAVVVGHEQVDHQLAEHLGARAPEGPLGGGIELDDPADVVDRDHAVERGLEHRVLARLAARHRALAALAVDQTAEVRADPVEALLRRGHHRTRGRQEHGHAEDPVADPDRDAERRRERPGLREPRTARVDFVREVVDPHRRGVGPGPAGQAHALAEAAVAEVARERL
jgi:hypothetical protein